MKDIGPDVGARRHKVHAVLVVLVPDQVIPLGQRLELVTQSVQTGAEHRRALVHRPHFLVARCARLRRCLVTGARLRVVSKLHRLRGFSRAPEILHAQQVLDVVVEELVEELLWVVATGLGPGACALPGHVALLVGLRFEGIGASFRGCFWVGRVRGYIFVGVVFAKQLTWEGVSGD